MVPTRQKEKERERWSPKFSLGINVGPGQLNGLLKKCLNFLCSFVMDPLRWANSTLRLVRNGAQAFAKATSWKGCPDYSASAVDRSSIITRLLESVCGQDKDWKPLTPHLFTFMPFHREKLFDLGIVGDLLGPPETCLRSVSLLFGILCYCSKLKHIRTLGCSKIVKGRRDTSTQLPLLLGF